MRIAFSFFAPRLVPARYNHHTGTDSSEVRPWRRFHSSLNDPEEVTLLLLLHAVKGASQSPSGTLWGSIDHFLSLAGGSEKKHPRSSLFSLEEGK